jgi:hypothetical protein
MLKFLRFLPLCTCLLSIATSLIAITPLPYIRLHSLTKSTSFASYHCSSTAQLTQTYSYSPDEFFDLQSRHDYGVS